MVVPRDMPEARRGGGGYGRGSIEVGSPMRLPLQIGDRKAKGTRCDVGEIIQGRKNGAGAHALSPNA
jgi:hypothetical protein